jgi:hypothetical protein
MKPIKIILLLGLFFLSACDKNKIDPEEFNDLVKALSYLDQPEELPEPVEVAVVDTAESSGGHY